MIAYVVVVLFLLLSRVLFCGVAYHSGFYAFPNKEYWGSFHLLAVMNKIGVNSLF